ncbi:hypothetical protein UB31_07625 [Bradyrhizobium sp. LTSP849]|jgi:hypothetical protein|nr:hypothetical protein UB31_07625 [Bradyrhizobium sp. LTSP849]
MQHYAGAGPKSEPALSFEATLGGGAGIGARPIGGVGPSAKTSRSWISGLGDEVMEMAMRERVTNQQNSIGILLFSISGVVSNSPTEAVVRVKKMRNPRPTAACVFGLDRF